MDPITREEMFLAQAAGNGTAPTPVTREEMFLAAAAGVGTAPAPITRKEMFLAAISGGGGGGGGGGFDEGTITFAEKTQIYKKMRITHNLGAQPQNILWFVESSTSTDANGRLIGAYMVSFVFVSKNICAHTTSSSSSQTSPANLTHQMYTGTIAQSIYEAAEADEIGVNLFFSSGYFPTSSIPAGSTIRWIVW